MGNLFIYLFTNTTKTKVSTVLILMVCHIMCDT
uniref:Uncharacterized protein n=1 Tax=Anguilla anguilla TaxID=7936 RepID=A0A0E9UJ34_ANGAN